MNLRSLIRSIIKEATEHPPVRGGEKLMRWGDGRIVSLNDKLESGEVTCKWTALENGVKYSRSKFNRMVGNEQSDYRDQLNRKKRTFNLEFTDGSSLSVPKRTYRQVNVPEQPEKNFFTQH